MTRKIHLLHMCSPFISSIRDGNRVNETANQTKGKASYYRVQGFPAILFSSKRKKEVEPNSMHHACHKDVKQFNPRLPTRNSGSDLLFGLDQSISTSQNQTKRFSIDV